MTEDVSEVPKELLESVRDVIGRKIKIILKKKVKLEVKGDKVENKVLVLTSCRVFLLAARIPTKLELTFNYLEIQGINCCKPAQLIVETDRCTFPLKLTSSEEVNEVVGNLGSCLKKMLPGVSPMRVMKKVTMEPSDRLSTLQALWDNQNIAEPGPCGGFSQMYACVCDWLGLPYREEVQWDVDTIYLTQDTRELNLQDFSHLDHRDLIPIVAALEYNQWFTKLSSKDLKLSTDVCEQILRVVARSTRLEELVLENGGLRTDFAQKLASALAHNPNSRLHTINLANNPLEDRGMFSLSNQFAKIPKGLKHLNMSKTSLSPKGVNILAQSLSANQQIPNSLTHLDLSGNFLRGDDLSNLYSFLAQPNALVHLDLSNTDCALDMVCAALLRGCCQELATLHLAKSIFSHRKGKEVPPSFKLFFSSSLALRHINLSGTKLPPDAVKALLLGLSCNPQLKDVSLDLSNCELGHCLRSGGAQILEGCIAEIHNISKLDISDNGLDSDLATLVIWMSKNRSIRHLALGKNFNNIKSKNLAPVLDNIVQMIQDEESPLESLSLADSKLKTELTIIINALGSNSSLTKVDISGNGMGDIGAKMLGKALQINTKLRTVIWDKNNITAQGFQDIAVALEKNYTLRFMPIPVNDASQALKANPERTEEALQKIENYLLRNHETRKYLQEQAYRLQQGIVTSTTQQMIDRMCVKVQDHLNSLRYSGADTVQEDVRLAENFMRDAKNSKTLLPRLYHLRGDSWAAGISSSSNPIQEKLESMAGEVTRVVDEQLKTMLESMVDAAEGLCPHVMRKAHLRQNLIEASTEKVSIPRTFVKNVLLEQSGIDILNKISEVKLTVASFLSDHIVDEILEALSSSQHKLANHLTKHGKPLPRQESTEIEVLEEKPTKRLTVTTEELSELERLEELDTCMMTPKSKRKSIHSRMLRPVSRAFEMEFDLDKALEEIPVHFDDSAPASSNYSKQERSSRPSSMMNELPSEEVKKLEHYTKSRPKRNKKLPPSKTALSAAESQEGEQNGLMSRIDEGVDEFFTKKVTRMESKRLSLRSAESLDSSDSEDKKRKDSKKTSFLNLIKSRSSKTERPQTVIVPEEPSSPKGIIKSPAPDLTKRESKQMEQNGSTEHSEEHKTPDSVDAVFDDTGKAEKLDSKSSPQGGRWYGVQVMGSGLLAEFKAKQEKRAAVQKKLENEAGSKELNENVSNAADRLDETGRAKGQQTQKGDPSLISPEKLTKPEPKTETVKSKSSSTTPTSPKTPPQILKPSNVGRPSIPQKPRPSWSTDESPESSSGHTSPKIALVPPALRRMPSDKDGQSSPPFSGPSSWSSSHEELFGLDSRADTEHDSEMAKNGARVKRTLRQSSTGAVNDASEIERKKSQPITGQNFCLPGVVVGEVGTIRQSSMSETSSRQSPRSEESKPGRFAEDQESRGKEKISKRERQHSKTEGKNGSKSSDSGEEGDKDYIFV
ncbi:F-actin-uncapping protein LRRC16A-like isoform X3 [Scyliorhinus canicula]|uniref:F-actin-uncapping protein LRRC16A-like isoform X3 n=1 Tax=Scyliorhinus canicula TaxID=7830 RepID=UPI0018F354F1|nr:F-actin-uncapping protein LRRC16A-like isoform X3 [Scyliorhinus canicula]